MRNPLENEETAFRFVFGTIAYLAPIVVASWIAAWLGFVVFVLATATVVALLRRDTKPPPARPPAERAQVEDTPRVEGTSEVQGPPVIPDDEPSPDDHPDAGPDTRR